MINSWLNSISNDPRNEQDILQDLIDENIQAGGVDFTYLPRESVNPDDILGESSISKFKGGFQIEMFIDAIQEFNGDGDLFSKFGLESRDSGMFVCSVRRFKSEAAKFNIEKPRQGDLIIFPINNTIWEVRKVLNDEYFFQFGKNYTYRVSATLYNPSHEEIESSEFSSSAIEESEAVIAAANEDALSRVLGLRDDDPNSLNDELEEFGRENVSNFDPNNPF